VLLPGACHYRCNPWSRTSVQAIEVAARAAGYRLSVTSIGTGDSDSIRTDLDFLLRQSIEALVIPHPLPKLPVARAIGRPAPDLTTSATAWLTAGAAHHTVMSTALGVDAFRDFADIARTEPLVIDEDTTLRSFTSEVRWNQAYYRLAGGI
jgi:L-arabinose isomerase